MKMSRIKGIIGALVLLFVADVTYAQSADEAYQAAYELVLSENWSAASDALRSFSANHSGSKWEDDAQYWQCHAAEKRGDNLERVFECYQEFVSEYDRSSWVDDAESSMVRVGKRLVDSGHREYDAILKSLGSSIEEDVRLAALDALWQSGDAQALEAMVGLYDEGGSPAFKKKIIFGLSQFEDPAANRKLRQIAENDPDMEARKDAIFWIVESGGEEALSLLESLMTQNQSVEIQKQVVFAYSQMDNDGVDPLINIARTSRHEEVRKDAVFWLGQLGGPRVVAFYDELFSNSDDPVIQKQILFGLYEMGDEASVGKLAEVARTHPNVDLRREAIFWIGESNSRQAADLIDSIARSNPPQEVMKQIVFVYSQMGDAGLDKLEEISRNHPDLKVRKDALFWLGQEGGSRATRIVDEVLANSNDPEMLDQALFALGQMESEDAVDRLIDLAKHHENQDVRKRAVFYLGQSDHEKAKAALLDIVRGN